MGTPLLRPGLLAGRRIVLAGKPGPAVGDLLGQLEGQLLDLPQGGPLESAGAPAPDAVVLDLSAGVADGVECLFDHLWPPIRQVAAERMIPSGAGGRVILVAPRTGAGDQAELLRAALENLARTLSVEWARFSLTTVAIHPGSSTADEEIATLVAFLLSDAGGYFSGCRLELGATDRDRPEPSPARAR